MQLENILLSEISRRKTNTVWYHLYVESQKEHKWIYIYAKSSRLTDIKSKLVITEGEKKEGRDELGVFD